MKKGLFIVISITLVFLIGCSSIPSIPGETTETSRFLSSLGTDSEQEIKKSDASKSDDSTLLFLTGDAEQKKKYKEFESYGYDVDGEDLNFMAETLYAANESYGAFRLFDIIGIDTKAIDNTLHLNEYRKQWTKIKSGLDVFFDYSENQDRYYFFYERQIPGTYSTIPLGSRGPAGGYVFYDKGYYSDGWRFLEASPKNLPVKYAAGRYVISGEDVYVNGTKKYNSDCTGTEIGAGKRNTELLVNAIDSSIWEGPYAAKMCDSYVYTNPNNNKVYNDWFLPSLDELSQLISVSKTVDCNMVADIQGGWGYWWSSSEEYRFPSRVWGVSLSGSKDYTWNGNTRWQKLYVRPVRAF